MDPKELFILTQSDSIANHFIAELRDINIQKDSMRFRRNMERIGELLAYEVSKTLLYTSTSVKTPLGEITSNEMKDTPVLITILRAGLPLHQGFLNYFDRAESGFIGAYRSSHSPQGDFDINLDYYALPDIQGRIVVLIDPMLATGKSLVRAADVIFASGRPLHLHLVSAIASQDGIDHLKRSISFPYSIWTGVVDGELNSMGYILPGLGDAGDLSFGSKVDR